VLVLHGFAAVPQQLLLRLWLPALTLMPRKCHAGLLPVPRALGQSAPLFLHTLRVAADTIPASSLKVTRPACVCAVPIAFAREKPRRSCVGLRMDFGADCGGLPYRIPARILQIDP
jgi:hypothetical protein